MAVLSVNEDEVPDALGNLTDVYVIAFTVEGRPGSFTVQIPQSGDPIAAASAAIEALTAQVQGIYGL